VVTKGDDYIFFLFCGKVSPKDFIANSDILPLTQAKWDRVDRFYNIYFKMPFDCPKTGKLDTLYVCKGQNIPQNSNIISTIHYPEGLPAYSLIEFYPLSQTPSKLPDLPKDLYYMVEVENSPQFPDGVIPSDYPSFW